MTVSAFGSQSPCATLSFGTCRLARHLDGAGELCRFLQQRRARIEELAAEHRQEELERAVAHAPLQHRGLDGLVRHRDLQRADLGRADIGKGKRPALLEFEPQPVAGEIGGVGGETAVLVFARRKPAALDQRLRVDDAGAGEMMRIDRNRQRARPHRSVQDPLQIVGHDVGDDRRRDRSGIVTLVRVEAGIGHDLAAEAADEAARHVDD
jgi:hypothetical protein